MIPYYGDFAEDDTVNIPFNTFSSDDPSASVTITDLANADIKVHKDAHIDQIVTDGATVVIDFDGITGNHMINIDTSVDAAYATGSEYQARIEGTTVDGATINAWVGSFSIERAGGTIALLKLIQAAVITNAAGADVAADIIAVKAETATIVNDTDLIDDGTSGLAKIASDVDAILTDTGSTLDTLIKDIPTTSELALRTLLAADYTVVGDLGTVQSGDSFAVVNGTHGLVSIQDDVDEILTDTGSTLDTLVKDIPTNTEFAALLGALNSAAADGDPTTTDTIMAYIKQLINILIGTAGIVAFPAEAAPANAISLAEVIRAIHADVTGLNGSAMVGTDGANTVVPDAAGTAPTKTEIVDEWESQANTDPTGFKVNVMEVNGTGQTANDNGADINEILTAAGTTLDTILDEMRIALVNKMIITEADGATEFFNESDVSQGSIAATFTSDGTYTTRKRLVP